MRPKLMTLPLRNCNSRPARPCGLPRILKLLLNWQKTARVALVVGLFVMSPMLVFSQEGWGQVVLQNNTPYTGDIYIDGNYGCRAFGNGSSCTTQVRVGSHSLFVKIADGQSASEDFDLSQGQVYTYTISFE